MVTLREVLVKLSPKVLGQLDALVGLANAAGAGPSRWFRADVVSFAVQLLAKRTKGNVETFRRLLRGQADLLTEDEPGEQQADVGELAGPAGGPAIGGTEG